MIFKIFSYCLDSPVKANDSYNPELKISGVAKKTLHIEESTPGLAAVNHNWLKLYGSKGETAVDFGAGGGRDTFNLLSLGWNVIAIDKDPTITDRQFPKMQNLKIDIGGVELLGRINKRSIQLITAQRVLPFLSINEIEIFLSQVETILKSDGLATFSFFDVSHSWRSTTPPNRPKSDLLFFSDNEIQSILEKNFNIVEFKTLHIKNHPSAQCGVVENWKEHIVLARKK